MPDAVSEALADQHVRWAIDMQRWPELDPQSSPNATINNPEWFTVRRPPRARRDRLEFHERMKADLLAEFPTARRERRAIVLAGPPGAGKSSVSAGEAGERNIPHYREGDFLRIDADAFKERILTLAMRDGSYENFIKPERVKELEASGERFSPLELASLVHEESSILANQMRADAIEDGLNVVIDTVLSSRSSMEKIATQLEAAGYSVDVVDVEVDRSTSMAAVASRWKQGYLDMASGKDELGGRWVPSEYVDGVFAGGQSQPRLHAEEYAQRFGNVMSYQVWERSGPSASPERSVHQFRERAGGPLHDASVGVADGWPWREGWSGVRPGGAMPSPEAGGSGMPTGESPMRRRESGPGVEL